MFYQISQHNVTQAKFQSNNAFYFNARNGWTTPTGSGSANHHPQQWDQLQLCPSRNSTLFMRQTRASPNCLNTECNHAAWRGSGGGRHRTGRHGTLLEKHTCGMPHVFCIAICHADTAVRTNCDNPQSFGTEMCFQRTWSAPRLNPMHKLCNLQTLGL